jgi:hypothetical protein
MHTASVTPCAPSTPPHRGGCCYQRSAGCPKDVHGRSSFQDRSNALCIRSKRLNASHHTHACQTPSGHRQRLLVDGCQQVHGRQDLGGLGAPAHDPPRIPCLRRMLQCLALLRTKQCRKPSLSRCPACITGKAQGKARHQCTAGDASLFREASGPSPTGVRGAWLPLRSCCCQVCLHGRDVC